MNGLWAVEAFYDDDCGFCSASARFVQRFDRRRLVKFTAISDASLEDGPDADRLRAAMHVRSRTNEWFVGADGWARVALAVPILAPLAWVSRLPLVHQAVAWTYGVIAAHRQQISRLLGLQACRIPHEP
jgi:predicted DCC family thiol-disulfide oxidoreductase YuxK